MAVYINGMELPKDREIYLRIDEKGEVYVYGSYPTELYKAVPIPPHGKLIDADALKEAFCGNCFADEKPMECSEPCMDMRIILEAPTIIEAEEGE